MTIKAEIDKVERNLSRIIITPNSTQGSVLAIFWLPTDEAVFLVDAINNAFDPDEPAGECGHDYLHQPAWDGDKCVRCGTVEGEKQIVRDHNRKPVKHNLLPSLNDGRAQCPLCGYTDFDTEFMDDSHSVNIRCPSCAEDLKGEWYEYYHDHNRKYDPADVEALIEEWKNKTPLMFGEAAKWSRRMDVLIDKLIGGA